MKKMSIKMKVTLWYTGIIIMIMGMVMIFIFGVTDQSLMINTEAEVTKTVREFAEEIHFSMGSFKLEDDAEFYNNGVSISLYDSGGKRTAGTVPKQFPSKITLKTDENQKVSFDGSQWLVHDIALKYGENQIVWIRGILSLNMTYKLIHIVLLTVLISAPIVILISALVGYYITKRAFRPVEEIGLAADLIESGSDLSQRIPLHSSGDELDTMAQTFNRMFERLQVSFEREKQFTSDASHELRTPVSVILSQCEYALLPGTHATEMKAALETVLLQSQKMSALISQLLSLSRADHQEEALTFEAVNLTEVADLVIEELKDDAAKRNIRIIRDFQTEITLPGDLTLLMRLFLNLITNGICYGREHGFVQVTLYKEGNFAVGVVSDDGIGIREEDLVKIWRRFYRVDRSRTSENNNLGLGLGLSMVQWIISVHKGSIAAESRLGQGTEFTFKLPLS